MLKGVTVRSLEESELRKSQESKAVWRVVGSEFRRVPYSLVAITGLTVGNLVLSFVSPWLTKYLIDVAIPAKSLQTLLISCVCLLLASPAARLLSHWSNVIRTRLISDCQINLQCRVLQSVMESPLALSERISPGEIITTYGSDCKEILQRSISLVEITLQAVLGFFLSAYLTWRVSPTLLLLSLCAALSHLPVQYRRARLSKETTDHQQVWQSETSAFIIDSISGLKTTKLLGQEENRTVQLRDLLSGVHREALAYARRASLLTLPEAIISGAIPAAAYGYGGYLVMTGRTTLGAVVACLQYISRTAGSIMSMNGIPVQYQPLLTYARRISNILCLESDYREGLIPGERIRELCLEDVSFRYEGQDQDLFSAVNVEIRKGEIVSVVGPSGSGKSTLGAILCGLLRPRSGLIRVNRVSFDVLDTRWYRRNVCLVREDDYLFVGSLADNLKVALPSATADDLRWCCRYSALDEVIDELPEGLDTRVGSGGCDLSSGQRLRVSLARALLRRPSLLVLDEITANLDSPLEARIRGLLLEVTADMVVVNISHRPTTIAWGHRILRLEGGDLRAVNVARILPTGGDGQTHSPAIGGGDHPVTLEAVAPSTRR